MSKPSEPTRPIAVRRAAIADARAVARLIEPGFARHIAPTLSLVGQVAFRLYVTEKALRARLAADAVAWCAAPADAEPDALAGYAELRGRDGAAGGTDHLALLFTAAAWQRRGVARTLLATVIAHLQATAPDLDRLTVNASAYALPIYERLGFVRVAGDQEARGIVATLMQLELGPAAPSADATRPPEAR